MHSHFCWIKDQSRAAVHVWKWLRRQLRISRWSWSSTNQDWWVFSLAVFFFFEGQCFNKVTLSFLCCLKQICSEKTNKKKVFHPSKSKIYFKGLQEWKISIIHACSYEVLHKNMKNWGMKLKILHFNIAA